LLASGQLFGISLEEIAEPEPLHQFVMPGRVVTAGNPRLENQIVFHRETRNQVELLKHQAEPVAAQFRAPGIAEFADRRIGQPDLAAIGGIEACDQVQERALAAAGFTRQRDAFARGDRQVHPAQHGDLFAGRAVALGQAGHAKHPTGHTGIAVGHARRWTDLTMKIP